MFGLGPPEMVVIAVLGVLLFGKRLPEVGRSLGKGIIEFKKGLRGIEDEFESSAHSGTQRTPTPAVSTPIEPSVPKFEPPVAAAPSAGFTPEQVHD